MKVEEDVPALAVQVTQLSELTPGRRVVLMRCVRCEGHHEAMSLGAWSGNARTARGGTKRTVGVEVVPAPSCTHKNTASLIIPQDVIDEGRVYRLVDMSLDEERVAREVGRLDADGEDAARQARRAGRRKK